jgi:hypothetical protein
LKSFAFTGIICSRFLARKGETRRRQIMKERIIRKREEIRMLRRGGYNYRLF